MTTIFDKIISGKIPSYTVWEDDKHLAFLTPFANTPGVTVVIPKQNYGDDVLELGDEQYVELQLAVKTVGKLLKKAFTASRVAVVYEGTGVAHVHAKLYPLHGYLASQTNILDTGYKIFTDDYLGYISTQEGPMMDQIKLSEIQKQIRKTDS